MKNLIAFLFLSFLLVSPGVWAQSNDADNDESRYLEGAVPEMDGKVVFTKEFKIPGMTQEQIYQRMLKWLEGRLAKNNNANSRVVYTNPENGNIVGNGEEWMVFKSSALSLDRTLLNYQITFTCKPEQCLMEVEKIRYTYQEKEKYTAEGWIVDKHALNKTKTKLVRGLSKWRIKTVDFVDDLFDGAAQALGAADITPAPVVQKRPSQSEKPGGPVVIQQAQPVNPVVVAAPVVEAQPVAVAGQLKEVAPDAVPTNAIQISNGKLVIAIGSDAFNMTMMTANAGGSIGKVNGKPVVFTILSPDQAYELLEKAETYTVKFFPTGQNEPSVVLECKQLPTQTFYEGQPRTYIGEIEKAWIKE